MTTDKIRPFILNHNLSLHGSSRRSIGRSLIDMNTNSGNSYIAYSILKILSLPKRPTGVVNIFACNPLEMDFDCINSEYTHVFIVFQDHLGPDWNHVNWPNLSYIVSQIKIPIIVFSLGVRTMNATPTEVAEALSPDSVKFFQFLASKAVSIGIRGGITAEVLDALGIQNYSIVGCPTYFEAGRARQVSKKAIDEDSKVAGLGVFANRFIKRPEYILQSELDLLHALYDRKTSKFESIELFKVAQRGFQSSILSALQDRRVHFFPDMVKWKKFMKSGFHLAAGSRMHGAILALNVGCPVLITAGDMRAREMCSLFRIPHYPSIGLYDYPLDELESMASVDEINRAYDSLYSQFQEWLARCGLYFDPHEDVEFEDWPWTVLEQSRGIVAEGRLKRALALTRPELHYGEWLSLGAGSAYTACLIFGWDQPSPGFTWSYDKVAEIVFRVVEPGLRKITLDCVPLIDAPKLSAQRINVRVNGQIVTRANLSEATKIECLIPKRLSRTTVYTIQIETPDSTSLFELGKQAHQSPPLGIQLRSLLLEQDVAK